MTNRNQKKIVAGLTAGVMSLSVFFSMPAYALYISDSAAVAAEISIAQAVLKDVAARRQSGSAQTSNFDSALKQNEADQQAKDEQTCTDIEEAAKQAAERKIMRNAPPDPSKIIQNTSCFLDLATVKIPVIMTGMGFIDSIIQQAIQRFMTGVCKKAQNFLGDLQSKAMQQVQSVAGNGVAGLALDYAQTALPAVLGSQGDLPMGASLGSAQTSGATYTDNIVSTTPLDTSGYQQPVATPQTEPDVSNCPTCGKGGSLGAGK